MFLNGTHGADENVNLGVACWKQKNSLIEIVNYTIEPKYLQLMPYSMHHLNVGRLFAKIRSKPFVVACAVKQAIEGFGYLDREHINWHM